ncbi:hypothetical protein FisN_14Lu387 [Fistulifera solaris]|uniref:Uncharacterized protein n=1 Tax=Fistulifera solaris TaxID=1519565 RepID=A0A1Z5JHX5_FISSO|nr:hypothetical protein FisN_14Lu387 [Fistulifera solaris]|eukprot:GAX13610.1 hypothetical protein FisN_14Lu387 [Fistulifera solaris]
MIAALSKARYRYCTGTLYRYRYLEFYWYKYMPERETKGKKQKTVVPGTRYVVLFYSLGPNRKSQAARTYQQQQA